MAIKFDQVVRHGRVVLMPDVVYGFEDPDAEEYFIRAFGAKKSTGKAVHVYPQADISIDPETTFADGPNKGNRIIEGKTNG